MLSRLFAKSQTGHPKTADVSTRVPDPSDLVIAKDSVPGPFQGLLADIDALNGAENYAESLRRLRAALQANPDRPELVFARGATLFGWDRYWEALWVFEELASNGWSDPRLALQMGWTHLQLGHGIEAESWLRKALETDPDSLLSNEGLINALMKQGKFAEALEAYQRQFSPEDRDPRHLTLLCYLKMELGDLSGGEAVARQILAIDACQPGAWINLGMALNGQGRREEALHAFAEATRLDDQLGSDIDAFVNKAKQCAEQGQHAACIQTLEMTLPLRPSVEGNFIYGESLLKSGRFVEGWEQYEFRWLRDPLVRLRHGSSHPIWAGQDLQGKTLLVRSEQGVGDTIQFIRYLPLLKRLGATVLLGRFSSLAMEFDGLDRLVTKDDIPAYDYYVNLLSLPRIFGTTLERIPCGVPYIRIHHELVATWSTRMKGADTLRVGLVWAGNPVHKRDSERSMHLRVLAPLLGLDGVRFLSLQKGPAESQLAEVLAENNVMNLGPELDDFADTAAVISQLDLVISVDTAVAHLAGALGKPVWLLAQKDGEWRWLGDERDNSPWYPTMRIFRQAHHGDWPEVIQRVRLELERVAKKISPLPAPCDDRTPIGSMPIPPPPKEWQPGGNAIQGMTAVVEARAGIVQYFRDDQTIGKSISWYGEFLQRQVDLLGRFLKPGATVVEIAPGIGVHALDIAGRLGPRGHLFLFESRTLLHRVLLQNLKANQVMNVTVLKRVLGNGVEAVAMHKEHSDQSHVRQTPAGNRAAETLDDHLLEQLHLLKLNADADALTVLEGATETLWRLRPLLFIAASDGQAVKDVSALAKTLGYRCWQNETPLFNLDNFNHRTDDAFSGLTALAVLGIPEELEVDVELHGCVEI